MLKRTSLYEEHVRAQGRLIDFGGWELPVQYTGVIDEHLACRQAAGLFDVSHMGEVFVEGGDAEKFLDYIVTNNIQKLARGQAQYTVMCYPHGGVVDDLIIYKMSHEKFLVVVNASNTEKDFAWMKNRAEEFPCKNFLLTNESARYCQIAIQGPRALEILQKLTTTPLSEIKTYGFKEGNVLDRVPAILARTGYTGEDGFEIYAAWEMGTEIWRALLEAGKPLGLKPCGLGARDTLRLEMKYSLYGHELDENTNPLEAGLGWVVKLEKEDFVGKSALIKSKEQGLKKQLIGLKLLERGIPRQGYGVYAEDGNTQLGQITSGTQSPSLGQGIGIASVLTQTGMLPIGTKLRVDIRGTKVLAEVVSTPFYKK